MSADYEQWFLLNASPDVRTQIESFPALRPDASRTTPIGAVLLTDAELDHTLGLLLLREGRGLDVHATAPAYETLRDGTALLRTLEQYCPVEWRPVTPGTTVSLGSGLSYRAFDVPATKQSRFQVSGAHGRVVGYRLTDERTGSSVVYAPGVEALTPAVSAELEDCACLLFDGTCWHDDELVRLGLGSKTAHDMGHLPIAGQGGSLDQLSELPIERKVYIHINNSNPMLLEDGPERRAVEERGIQVAYDGLELRV